MHISYDKLPKYTAIFCLLLLPLVKDTNFEVQAIFVGKLLYS